MSGCKQIAPANRNHALRTALLVGTALTAVVLLPAPPVEAQTWTGATSNDWNTASNWSTNAMPTGVDTATFANNSAPTTSNVTVDLSSVGGITFDAGAPSYTVAIDGGSGLTRLNITGAGIVNNSGVNQFLTSSGSGGGTGTFQFYNSSSAGNAILTANVGGQFQFFGKSTASSATFVGNGGLLSIETSAAFSMGSISGSGFINFATGGAATLNVGGLNASTTYSGTIGDLSASDSGSLVKVGTGTLTLTGGNNYKGGTTISSGALSVGADRNLGAPTGAVTLSNGALKTTATFSSGRNFIVNTGAFDVAAGTSLTLTGQLGGEGNFTKSGTGTLVLGSGLINGHAGGMTIAQGAVSIQGNLGAGFGTITTTGSVFDYADGVNNAAPININSDTTQLQVLTGSASQSGVISETAGPRPLEKIGAGTLVLSGANTYTGTTTISGGTLALGNASGVGTGALTLGNGTTFRSDVTATLTNTINVNPGVSATIAAAAGQTLTLGGFQSYSGGAGTTLHVGSSTATGTVVQSAASLGVVDNNSAVSIDGGTFKVGTTFFFNAMRGGTTVGSGATSATLDVAGLAATATNLTGTSAGVITNSGVSATLTASNPGDSTFAGVFQDGAGTLALSKTGAGTLTLSGNSASQSGGLQIDSGKVLVTGTYGNAASVVDVNAGGALGGTGTLGGNVVVNAGGTLAAGMSPGTLNIAGNLTLNAGSISNFELGSPGVVGGASNDLVVVGGNLTMGGTVNLTNGAGGQITAGYYRLFNVTGAVGGAFGTVNAGTATANIYQVAAAPNQVNALIQGAGQLVQFWDGAGAVSDGVASGGAGIWNAANTNWAAPPGFAFNDIWRSQVGVFDTVGGAVTVVGPQNVQGLQFNVTGYTLSGDPINLTGDPATDPTKSFIQTNGAGVTTTIASSLTGLGLSKTGAGRLILSGANSYTTTDVTAGTLQIGAGGAAGTLGTGAVAVSAGATLAFNRSDAFNVTNAISGAGALRQIGAGVTTLSGATTYSGATTIAAGTLKGGALNALSANSAFVVDATLDLGGFNQTIGSLAGLVGGIVTNSGPAVATLTAGGDNSSTTFAGVIQNGAATTGLAKTGTGTLTLTGLNTYSGATTITAGTLKGGAANAFSAASAVSITGGTLDVGGFNQAIGSLAGLVGGIVTNSGPAAATLTAGGDNTSTTFDGVIQNGSGLTLIKSGTGTLALTNANTYAGGTNLNAGTIRVGANAALGTGALAMANGTTLQSGAAGLTIANAVGITGTGTVDTQANTMTLAGVVSGGALAKVGAGTLVLTNANTYGATTITAGALQIGAGGTTGTLGTGAVSIAAGGALAFNRSNAMTISNVISGAGTINQIGAGATTIASNSNTFTGTTNVNAGSLLLASGATLGAAASTINVNAGGTLGGVGTAGGAVNINAGGTLSAGFSPGTLTVAGNLTLNAGSNTNFELNQTGVTGGTNNDLVKVGGALTMGGTLNLTVASAGWYRLFDVAGATSGTFATVNSGVLTTDIYTTIPNQVNAFVRGAGQTVQFWDGADTTGVTVSGTGVVNGGTGTWTAANTNWTGAPGAADVNDGWRNGVAIFAGAAGTVTVAGAPINFQGMQFTVDGYTLTGGTLNMTGDPFTSATQSFITTDAGVTTTINSVISGAAGVGLSKNGGGTLVLNGANTYTGATNLNAGTLRVGSSTALGVGAGAILNMANGTTLQSGAAVLTLTNAVAITGAAMIDTQANTMTLAGAVSGGAMTKTGTGTLILSNANTYGATTISAGVLQVGAGGATGTLGAGAVVNNATLAFNRSDALTVASAISGTGAVNQIGAGTTILAANNSYTGVTTISAGTLQIGAGGASGTLGTAAVVNNGALSFNRSDALTVANVISGTGAVNQIGAGVTTLSAANTYTGATNVIAGTLTLTGSIASNVVNAATFNTSGTVGNGLLNNGVTNASGGAMNGFIINSGVINVSGAMTGNNVFNNNAGSTLNLAANMTGITTFNNAGTVATTGNRTLGAATFNNLAGGLITMQNGVATETLTLTGAYAGGAGSTIRLDANMSIPAATSDRVSIAGAGAGTSAVSINSISGSAKTFFATPITLISGGGAATFTAAGDAQTNVALASTGIVDYAFKELAPGSGNWGVVATLNTGAVAGPASQITSSLASINTSFFQNTSSFIGGPPTGEANKWFGGLWIRPAAGGNTISSISTSSAGAPAASKIGFGFSGYQIGADGSIGNVNNSGFNLHFGLTGGEVKASSSEQLTAGSNAKFSIPFFGAYMAVTGHGFFLDMQLRHDIVRMKINNTVANLANAPLKASGTTFSASLGYRYDIGGYFIEPSATINVSRHRVDQLNLAGVGTLNFNTLKSTMGRIGLRFGTTVAVNDNLALQPFVSASLWREFEGAANTTFVSAVNPADTVSISTGRVGTFTQISAGVAGQMLKTPLIGFLRGDVRFGQNINGWAATGGLRYQF